MDKFVSDLKIARENAVIGNYSASVSKYQAILTTLKSHIINFSGDPTMKLKWKTAIDQITREA